MGILEIVKRAGIGAVEADNPVAVLFGTVSKVDPLEIEIHSKLKLTKEFLVLTERVTRYEVDLEHTHKYTDDSSPMNTEKSLTDLLTKTPIRTGLKLEDKVVLLRVQGGQKFVVLDKVVDS